MTDFGTRLKQARKKQKMTQKQLAQMLGVEQSAISNYEKNLRAPSAGALIQIANQLKISLDDLLGRTDPDTNTTMINTLELSNKKDNKRIQQQFLNYLLQENEDEAQKLVLTYYSSPQSLLPLFSEVLVPTLTEVGVLWEKGAIDITREHLISHMVDRLIATLESTLPEPSISQCSAMFMLPGSEEHQLTLKMAKQLFKANGWRTYYMGRSIPMSSLEIFLKEIPVNLLVLAVTLDKHLNSTEHLIRAVKSLPIKYQPKIVIGGNAITDKHQATQVLGADLYVSSLSELDQLIKEIKSCA